MINTEKTYPFWKTTLEATEAAVLSARRGEAHVLCRTPGGHTIRYLTYGEKVDYCRRANYSSACGAKDPSCYADREGKRPTILLFGATHGQETEGVAAILNLISVLETGKDLRGCAVPEITETYEKTNPRLILIPVYNADGRARCVCDSMLGETPESLRRQGQGTWKDGTLCGWPDCKKIHPIREAAGFLGAYYNDDGVNLMHDNFFSPMAEETKALLALCDAEAPECIIGLHGGSNSTNFLLQPAYTPRFIRESVRRLALAVNEREAALGYRTLALRVPGLEDDPPASFNLTSALHHVCGAVSATYESNEGLKDENAFGAEEILLRHYCLFEEVLKCAWRA